jgi:hypothetical protein
VRRPTPAETASGAASSTVLSFDHQCQAASAPSVSQKPKHQGQPMKSAAALRL